MDLKIQNSDRNEGAAFFLNLTGPHFHYRNRAGARSALKVSSRRTKLYRDTQRGYTGFLSTSTGLLDLSVEGSVGLTTKGRLAYF